MNPENQIDIGKLYCYDANGKKINLFTGATIEITNSSECDVEHDLFANTSISFECKIQIPEVIKKAARIFRRSKSGRIKKKLLVRMIKENWGFFDIIPMRHFLQ